MIITLCGSTRFKAQFEEAYVALCRAGHQVFTLTMFGREPGDEGKDADFPLVDEEEKVLLDLLHFARIEESDAVLVVCPGAYLGFSTRREIAWAKLRGKAVYYTDGEADDDPNWTPAREIKNAFTGSAVFR